MAYDSTKPADDEYLSAFPAEAREQLRAILEDQIVNALKLQGLVPGNASGQLPVSNGNVNANLNADQVDGKDASYFSPSTHVHSDATQNADGFMSKADKTKLDGVATGAEVNQNTFSNVAVGSITIQADGKQDTLTIAQGANITITADATNDKLTVAVSGTVPNATNAATAVTCTGNSATATKWQTARKIGGVSVDGSADIDLPGVNKAGTQDTSGSATKHGGYTVAQLFDYFHPVGCIYESTSSTNPADIWGVGTWVKMDAGRVLISAGTYTEGEGDAAQTYTYALGATGGEAKHTITVDEMPSHSHATSNDGGHNHTVSSLVGGSTFLGGHSNNNARWGTATTSWSGGHSHTITATGGSSAHENRPPYTVVNRWRRTA
jgi:hypothetical protein